MSTKTNKRATGNWRFWLGLGLSIICLIWLITQTNWSTTWQTILKANYGLILVVTVLNLASIPLRAIRWQAMFSSSEKPSLGRLTSVMLVGQALNVVMPARMGDLIKANLVGTSSAAHVISTIILQSILDLMMVSGLIIILLLNVSLPNWMRGSAQALLITTLIGILGVGLLLFTRIHIINLLETLINRLGGTASHYNRLRTMIEQFLQGFALLKQHPSVLMGLLFWSILIWATYGAFNYVLLYAVGISGTWLTAFFVLVVLQIGTAVPSSPGRIGVYHYLSVEALAVFGILEAQALSFAIIAHIISIVLPMILGLALGWKMKIYAIPDQTVKQTSLK
ncbi:MAG: lysylphosphatidylglycerol synthase transmembrane domain-containing protein [Chloroflexota bacterium]